jgi:Fe-S-cluster containining protein
LKPVAIQFRDKKDIRPLPQIPSKFAADMQELLKTKINRPELTYFQKLEAIYAFTDRFNAFVATFAVCQKGCNHCCKIDVQVSRIEAEYITFKGGPQLDQGEVQTIGHRTACPFIGKDGSCTVYDTRPFNCRTFHTLDDPKYCADGDVDHQVYGAAGVGYGVGFYRGIAAWLKGVHDTSGLPYRDIRDWFPSKPSLMNRLISRFKE